MPWLLDTNILSEIRRPKPEPRVLAFIAACPLDDLYISAVTLAELGFGIERLEQGERRNELSHWLALTVGPMFNQRVLRVTEDIIFRWRVLMEQGRRVGHTYSQPDLLIAATALHYAFKIVTRDRDDFDKAGVSVINPWEDPPQRMTGPQLTS
ncbi:MAG: type II toxin-antitoxin system VapC family toxin [Acidobacteriaceae bacterium]|nr:type II toxin-antitoxin system VapC family toxin [Acidobacteriaceae bacterium]